jgi:AcrR family transcriptional regulator
MIAVRPEAFAPARFPSGVAAAPITNDPGDGLPGRKERHLQFRTDSVLDAAVELFSETSYEDAPVEAIARRAGVSVATVYALFDSKRDIYKATIARAHDRFFTEIRASVAETRGPLEQLRAIIRYHLESFSGNARSFRAFARSANVAGMELKNEVEREATTGKREFFEMVVDICARGIDEGVFRRGLPPTELALAVTSVPHSVLTYWLDKQDGQEGELLELLPAALTLAERLAGADD